jgi:hypothetical protein
MRHVTNDILTALGKELTPWQEDAINHTSDNNVLIRAPAGAGKSLPAQISLIRDAREGRAAIYMCPYVTLMRQFAGEMAGICMMPSVDLTVGIKEQADIICTTYEAGEKILCECIRRSGIVVLDECHHLLMGRGNGTEAIILSLLRASEHRVLMMSSSIGRKGLGRLAEVFNGLTVVTGEGRSGEVETVMIKKVAIDLMLRLAVNSLLNEQLGEGMMVFCGRKRDAVNIFSTLLNGGSAQPSPCFDPRRPTKILGEGDSWAASVGAALRRGLILHYRGIGERYSRAVMKRIASQKPGIVICTSTLAEGMNVRCCNNVVIHSLHYGASLYTFEQMHGRAGRWSRLATCYITGPPPAAAEEEWTTAASDQTLIRFMHTAGLELETARATLGDAGFASGQPIVVDGELTSDGWGTAVGGWPVVVDAVIRVYKERRDIAYLLYAMWEGRTDDEDEGDYDLKKEWEKEYSALMGRKKTQAWEMCRILARAKRIQFEVERPFGQRPPIREFRDPAEEFIELFLSISRMHSHPRPTLEFSVLTLEAFNCLGSPQNPLYKFIDCPYSYACISMYGFIKSARGLLHGKFTTNTKWNPNRWLAWD